jgi:hypothetical protein
VLPNLQDSAQEFLLLLFIYVAPIVSSATKHRYAVKRIDQQLFAFLLSVISLQSLHNGFDSFTASTDKTIVLPSYELQ